MFEEHKTRRTPSVTVIIPSEDAGLVNAIFPSPNCNDDTQGAFEGDSDAGCHLDREHRRVWTGACQFLNSLVNKRTSVSVKVKDLRPVMFRDSDIFWEFRFHGGWKE